jgi:hypothetical protein
MNMGRRPGKCEQAVRIARPSPVISIRRREEIGSRLRQRRRRASRHRVIASRRAQRLGVVQPAFVTQMGMRKLPLVLLVPLPSKLRGKSIPTRCSAPVVGIADGFTYRAHEAKDFKLRSARVEINIKRIG